MCIRDSLSSQQIREEVKNSLIHLKSNKVDPLPYFALPEGEISSDTKSELEQLGIKFGLGLGDYDLPKDMSTISILGRVNMYQAASDTVGAFAARIWDIRLGKFFY